MQHYCANNGNSRQAWIAAGYNVSGGVRARRLLDDPEVANRIREVLGEVLSSVKMDAVRIKQLLTQAATFDPRDIYDDEGNLLPVHKWPDEIAQCVQSVDVEVTRSRSKDDPDEVEEVVVKKVRFIDRGAAQALLARHYKIVGAEDDGVNALANALADRLNEAKHRRIHNLGDVTDATIVQPQQIANDPAPVIDVPVPAYQESDDESLV